MRIQERVSRVENKVDVLATKVDALASKVDDFIEEMRDKDRQRAAEILALRAETAEREEAIRAEMAESNKKLTEEIGGIKADIKNLDRYFHNLTLAASIGVGAAVIGVLGGVGAMVYAALTR